MHSQFNPHALAGLALLCAAAAAPADEARVVSADTMHDVVSAQVLDVAADGVIHARLTNHGDGRVQAAEVLARYDWVWRDSRHPGGENPGWVTFKHLPVELAPNQSVEFEVAPGRALPTREDGQIMTSLAVVSVTEIKSVQTR